MRVSLFPNYACLKGFLLATKNWFGLLASIVARRVLGGFWAVARGRFWQVWLWPAGGSGLPSLPSLPSVLSLPCLLSLPSLPSLLSLP